MSRYFAVNSLAGAFRTSTAVVEDTTAGRFDSAYVQNSISISTGDYFYVPIGLDATSATTLWTRADFYLTGYGFNGNTFLQWMNGTNNAYRVILSSNPYQMQYWNGSSWVNWGTSVSLGTISVLKTLTIKIVCGVSYQFYVGGALASDNGGVTPSGTPASQITSVQFNNNGNTVYWSQIMGADYDIRDAHIMPATLNGNSAANTGGTGSYTDINETVLDDSTAEVVATSGNAMGQTHGAITVPASFSISGLVLNARGRVAGGTVTDGKLGVRSSGTNYASAAKGYNGAYEPRSAIWATDPATGAAWTNAGFNSAETFIQAN